MFEFTGRVSAAHFRTEGEFEPVIQDLAKTVASPLLRSIVRAAAETAALRWSRPRLSAFIPNDPLHPRRPANSPVGDMFITDERILALYPVANKLVALEVRRHDVEPSLTEFCAQVAASIRRLVDGRRVRGMSFEWRSTTLERRRVMAVGPRFLTNVKLETRPADPSPDEMVQAEVLVAPEQRAALLRLAQVGKARIADPAFQADNPTLLPLLRVGLARREFLVTCRQDSHTICTVAEREQLEATAAGDARCSVCGRQFRAEQVHEIVALSEQGRKMLDGSHWMTVWVTKLLVDAGVNLAQISWNAASGEDELDILLNLIGIRTFFELKDREFGLGDAYPFAARVTRYGGEFGIVLSTDRVADEAKRFLSEGRVGVGAPEFSFLETADLIRTEVPRLVTRLSRVAIQRQISDTIGSVGPAVSAIVDSWLTERQTP